MHNIKYILVALISIGVLNAQTVSGTVSDSDGNSLMGANVSVEGTDLGSASNNDGSFSVTGMSAGTYTITASYIGLESASSTVTVGDGQTVTVNLSLDKGDIRLNQVVVAASKKKELVTDAPASVEVFSNEELTVRNTTSIAGHTEGRAGVETMKTGMESSNVTVRGFNGIFSGAMNVIVDNRWARPPVITATSSSADFVMFISSKYSFLSWLQTDNCLLRCLFFNSRVLMLVSKDLVSSSIFFNSLPFSFLKVSKDTVFSNKASLVCIKLASKIFISSLNYNKALIEKIFYNPGRINTSYVFYFYSSHWLLVCYN